jgi:hypothetical protein
MSPPNVKELTSPSNHKISSRTAIVSNKMFAQLEVMVEKASPATAAPSGFRREHSLLASGIRNLLAG